VVQTVPVGVEGVGGSCTEETVLAGIDFREATLPDVAAMPPVRLELVTPRIPCPLQAAARGDFPFGFGGESLAGPGRVSSRISPGDVNDGMLGTIDDIGSRSFRSLPARTVDSQPPRRALNRSLPNSIACLRVHQRIEDEGPTIPLRVAHVARPAGERGELAVGDCGRVDQVGPEIYLSDRALSVVGKRIAVIAACQERSAGNQDHSELDFAAPPVLRQEGKGLQHCLPTSTARAATPGRS